MYFQRFEGYKRALEIADSPNVGMCFCVGCWLEGGELMGKDVIESIRYFGERNKIFKVHFRNVDQPLPHFVETFVDNVIKICIKSRKFSARSISTVC